MKDDEARRTYSTHGRHEKSICGQKSERKIRIFVRVILRWILKGLGWEGVEYIHVT